MKPKRLRPGDVIGICAPAGPLASRSLINAGIRYLEHLGFRVELSSNLYRKHGYLAGSDAERIADLHELFGNKKVKAIFAARGGFGSHRIISSLDYGLIRRNPKIVLGYSDITALHLAIFSQTGLTSVTGPMAAEIPSAFTHETEELFWRCLTSAKPLGSIDAESTKVFDKGQRSASGRILGGNLSLAAALSGTKYFPALNNSILLLEEIDERPYRVDRMLQQMKLAGLFQNVSGILLGQFTDCAPAKGKPSLTVTQVFRETFERGRVPIISGFSFGHIKHSLTFPIGVRVRMSPKTGSVEFLESAVS